MTVLCPGCRRAMRVPPEKENVPNLRARCTVCGTVFAVAEASLAFAPVPLPAVPAAPAAPRLETVPQATAPPARPAPPAVWPAGSPAPSSVRRPGSPAPGTPPPPAAPTAGPPSATPAVARARTGPSYRSSWRRCATHLDRPSEAVCTTCGKGWCLDCLRREGTATICATCDALCVSAAEREAREARSRQRARPLFEEAGTILRYPFTDPTAFVAFAVVVGLFSVAASIAVFGGAFGILFSQGLLYGYAFTAINRVSVGEMSGFMPEIGDLADLAGPLRVGIAALIVSSGPLLALTFLHSPADVLEALGGGRAAAVVAPTPGPSASPTLSPTAAALLHEGDEASGQEEPSPEEEPEAPAGPLVPAWVLVAYVFALLWKLVYSPIALVAGAISHSFLRTLNPAVGVDAIQRMGSTYWTAMGLYTGFALAELALGGLLGLVPFAGAFFRAFVQSYSYLAIGCLLGLAVFKKAPELGLD